MFKVEAWKCEYCGKLYSKHKDCKNHEDYNCSKNIHAFNCKDCLNYIKSGGGRLSEKNCAKHHKISVEQFENCKDKKFIWDLSGTLPEIEKV